MAIDKYGFGLVEIMKIINHEVYTVEHVMYTEQLVLYTLQPILYRIEGGNVKFCGL